MEITQGNWITRFSETGIDVIEEKSGFGIVCLGSESELKDADYPIEEAKANAKLIAAAPKLRDFAIEMVKRYPNSPWIYEQANRALANVL